MNMDEVFAGLRPGDARAVAAAVTRFPQPEQGAEHAQPGHLV